MLITFLLFVVVLLQQPSPTPHSSKPAQAFRHKVMITARPGRCKNVKYTALNNETEDLGPTPTAATSLAPKKYVFTCTCENGTEETQSVRTQEKWEIEFSCAQK